MAIKIVVVLLLLLILLSLGAAMFSLIADGGKTKRLVRFLNIRILISVVLFIVLIVAFFLGWIQPHGILPPAG